MGCATNGAREVLSSPRPVGDWPPFVAERKANFGVAERNAIRSLVRLSCQKELDVFEGRHHALY